MHETTAHTGLHHAANPSRPGASEQDLLPMGRQLLALLQDLTSCYEQIESLNDRREEAIRAADTKTLTECLKTESDVVDQVIRAERRREGIVAFFTEQLGAASAEQASARFIAERLPEPALSDQIVAAADNLRAIIDRTQAKNEAARITVETMAKHMQGLLRTAAERMSQTGAYGARGTVRRNTQVVSSVDLTS